MDTSLFTELNLSKEIERAVKDMGFEEATPIQSQSIPLILNGKDVIGHSQTGTGKTAAFGIPAIELCDTRQRSVQTLVLCPTRELAMQACDEIGKFAKYKRAVKATPIYGGQPIERQIRSLKQGAQIVIGTPGRIMDHLRRHTLKLNNLKMVVLDEADEMLNMGFRDDIETILKEVPSERQTVLFSATMSREIMGITKRYQKEPVLVKIVREELTVPSIKQYYYEVPQGRKVDVLERLLDVYNPKRSIIFCNTKRQVDELTNAMNIRGYLSEGLHGDMKQQQRTKVMDAFKAGKTDILIATDVAARGIDVDDIEAVFNYDIPQDLEYYVHRIGRTGRAGRDGRAFTFVSGRRQIYELREIEKFTKTKIKLKAIPSNREAMETRMNKFIVQIKEVLEKGHLEEANKVIDRLLEEDFTTLEIACALVKMHMPKDISMKKTIVGPGDMKRGRGNMASIMISIGKNLKICPKHIVGAIAGESGIPGKDIGSIQIFDNHTLVQIPKDSVDIVISSLNNKKIAGRNVSVSRAK